MSGKKAVPEMRGDFAQRRRRVYMRKFSLTYTKPAQWLPAKFMDQLDRCADDDARRILLGVSK